MGLLAKGLQFDVTDVVVAFDARVDRTDANDVTYDLDVERFILALADDRERDWCVDPAAHLLDSLLEAQTDDLLAVEVCNKIISEHAGLGGWRIVDRCDHLDHTLLHRDLDTETTELAARLHLHVAEALRCEIGGVRVQRRQHAVDRSLDQFCIVGLFDVVGAHALKHIAEEIKLLVDFRIRRRRRISL